MIGFVLGMPKEEIAWSAEGDGGDAGVGTEKRFGIGMIRDGIVAIGVIVDQGKIVSLPRDLFNYEYDINVRMT